MNDLTIYFAQSEQGTFLAATNESPRFCIEAETEEELEAKVRAALAFYQAHRGRVVPSPTATYSLTRFLTTHSVRSDELTAA